MTFDLSIVNNCILRITGTPSTQDTNYKNTYTINVIKYKKSNVEFPEILATYINPHEKTFDESLHPLTKDGHYVLDHIILSSVNSMQGDGYCTDGISIYKYVNGNIKLDNQGNPQKIQIEELIEVNDPSVVKFTQNTFSICFIHKCYLNLCNQKLNKLMNKKCVKKSEIDDFNMDLVWISLNAIRYNVEFGYLDNAQSILEDLVNCTNICNQNKYFSSDGCGCVS